MTHSPLLTPSLPSSRALAGRLAMYVYDEETGRWVKKHCGPVPGVLFAPVPMPFWKPPPPPPTVESYSRVAREGRRAGEAGCLWG
jgi:hypothetical protein